MNKDTNISCISIKNIADVGILAKTAYFLFAKCGDICHDLLTGTGGKGGGAAFGNDFKAFVYNSGGDIGATKVNADTVHG